MRGFLHNPRLNQYFFDDLEMSLPLPTTPDSLLNFTAIAALDPSSIQLKMHPLLGETITFLPNHPSSATSLFIRFLEIYKSFTCSASFSHQIEGIKSHLNMWASRELTGQAKILLPNEISFVKNENNQEKKKYSIEECQKILSLIHSAIKLHSSCLKYFSADAAIKDCQKLMLNSKDSSSESKDGQFIVRMNFEIDNPYLFALSLRNFGFFFHERRYAFSIEQIEIFLSEAKKLQAAYPFEKCDQYMLDSFESFLKRQDAVILHKNLTSQLGEDFSTFSSLYKKTGCIADKLSFLESTHSFFLEMWKSLSVASDNSEFSEEEASSFVTHVLSNIGILFSYHEFYKEIWDQLSLGTRTIHTMIYKKHLVTQNPLPSSSEICWTFKNEKSAQRPKPPWQKEIQKKKAKATRSKQYISQENSQYPNKSKSGCGIKLAVPSFPSSQLISTSQQAQPFLYHRRVLQYFDTDCPINEDRRFHGFALAVDDYILKLGIRDEWENSQSGHRDPMWRIPAEFRFDGTINRGEIIYCFYRKKPYFKTDNSEKTDLVCYHRFFHRRSSSNFQEFIESRTSKPSFIENEHYSSEEKAVSKLQSDKSKVISENECFIEIDDFRNKTTIRLFVVNDDHKSDTAPSPKMEDF